MKRKLLTLLTVLSMCCLVACGTETKNDTGAGGNNDEPVVTEAPADEPEATPAPADDSVTETTPEPTEAPTPEPTTDPAETLTTLRNEALAAHSAIIEQIQYRFDVASEILEVAKGYPDFTENDYNFYNELLLSSKSDFEQNLLTWDIDNTIASNISLNIVISTLLEEYPDIKTTAEFTKYVKAPNLDILMYNDKVFLYNYALSNSSTSEFEELPSCSSTDTKIEY